LFKKKSDNQKTKKTKKTKKPKNEKKKKTCQTMNPEQIPQEPPTMPNIVHLATQINELQAQLSQAQAKIAEQEDTINKAATSYLRLSEQLYQVQAVAGPKKNKPDKFSGKSSVKSWVTHMDNYLGESESTKSLHLAASYLSGTAHEWWIGYSSTEGKEVQSWCGLKQALLARFDTLNKEKIARDKLARWRQVKDVATFNDDFQRILLDIPNISTEEQIDRYTRGLKPYIWKELCTKDYIELSDAMKDAERVESAHRRAGKVQGGPNGGGGKNNNGQGRGDGNPRNDPMDLGNVELRKLTKEERDECMKKGLCLRCRQPGHIAKNCPKAKGN